MKKIWQFSIAAGPKVAIIAIMLLLVLSNQSAYAQKVFNSPESYASYYIDASGKLYIAGFTEYNRVPYASTQSSTKRTLQDSVFILVNFPSGVTAFTAVAGGAAHTLALGNDGNIYSWGMNTYGQLGNGSTKNDSLPVIVTKPAGVTKWTAVAAGAFHSYALGDDGNIYFWGFNSFGQAGNGTSDGSSSTTPHSTPAAITKPEGVTSWKMVAAGNNAGYGIGDNDTLYAFGRNGNGQIGIGSTTDQKTPVRVQLPSSVTKVIKVASGSFYAMALGNDGNLYGFGGNGTGQIGDGTTTQANSPVMVVKPTGVTSWTEITCGSGFALATGNDGGFYAWGDNGNGELADGTGATSKYLSPAFKPKLPAGVNPVSYAGGHNHVMFIDQTGRIWSIGRNNEGELAIGAKTDNQLSPVQAGLPVAPKLLAPANGTTQSKTDTAFVWTHGLTAVSYNLQIASDSAFTSIVSETKSISDTLLTITSSLSGKLKAGTQYLWRVNGNNSFGTGNYSAAWSFTTPADTTPVVTIAEARKDADNNFIPDNLNKVYKVKGVVTSIDFTASTTTNNNYFIQDGTAGILLYCKPKLNKVLNIGDSVLAKGSIMQYKGVTEFAAVDTLVGEGGSVQVLKTGAKVPDPVVITLKDVNSEKYEGMLVTVKNLNKTASSKWPAANANGNLIVTAGADSTILFIDSDTDIDGKTEPTWPQDITGIVTQYATTSANNNGYELEPRSIADFKKSVVDAVEENTSKIPSVYTLEQNYPNPFNPTTNINFALPKDGFVSLKVYDLLGKEVSTLFEGFRKAGSYKVDFNASGLTSGVYLYRLQADGFVKTMKMLLMK